MMVELDYDALQRLADAATPGPWEAFEDSDEHLADCPPTMEWLVTATDPGEEFYEEIIDWGNRGRREDAEFIAASRSAVPALLDRVRELEAERDAALPIAKVREIHYPVEIEPSDTICGGCSYRLPNGHYFGNVEEWPCPKVRALGSVPSTGEGKGS